MKNNGTLLELEIPVCVRTTTTDPFNDDMHEFQHFSLYMKNINFHKFLHPNNTEFFLQYVIVQKRTGLYYKKN